LAGSAHIAPPQPSPPRPPPPPSPSSSAAATAAAHADGGAASLALAAAAAAHPLRPYWEYLSWLFRRSEGGGEVDAAEVGYRDFLQSPLQPLADNLESSTYEVFERDSTKYSTYGEAVYRALLDRGAEGDATARTTVRGRRGLEGSGS
jgi:protein arginine N-methyltransferase 5